MGMKAWLAVAALVSGGLPAAAPLAASAAEPALATDWVAEQKARLRLIGGGDGKSGLVAGIEIEMEDGWKTYWRNPGSSGVPPRVEWSKSQNVGRLDVQFPAPQRMADPEGDIIGYKRHVVLPVRLAANDPSLPISLKLDVELGICKDICIPIQASLELDFPAGTASKPAGERLEAALSRVPRPATARTARDPQVRSAKVELTGAKPHIAIEGVFPGGAKDADIFLEAPDGLWVPLAKRDGSADGDVARFVVDLTDGADVSDLKGKTLRVTLVSAAGQSETSLKLE